MQQKPQAINTVAILGTGLIGGSLGLAIRGAREAGRVVASLRIVGFDEQDTLASAIDRGALDTGARSARDAVAEADLVFLAAPLAANMSLLREVTDALPRGAIVTDVGSVKRPIEELAKEMVRDDVAFVGGHPMAGSEKRGISAADAYLFENATYVLCPPEPLPWHPSRINNLIDLLQALGARLLMMSSHRHDALAATVSHLPQLIAVTLAEYAANVNSTDPTVTQLAAGGFRDMTRIASSPYELWREILAANNGPILDAVAGFSAALRSLRNRLIEEDEPGVRSMFDSAREFRDAVPTSSKGFLRPLADVYVAAADRRGALHSITKALFENDLNIKDIELLKLREGTGGTFRIGFDSAGDADRAARILTADGHRAHTLET